MGTMMDMGKAKGTATITETGRVETEKAVMEKVEMETPGAERAGMETAEMGTGKVMAMDTGDMVTKMVTRRAMSMEMLTLTETARMNP